MSQLTDQQLDTRAIAYYTGQADARNGRPRRHNPDDPTWIGRAYTRGYNDLERERGLGT